MSSSPSEPGGERDDEPGLDGEPDDEQLLAELREAAAPRPVIPGFTLRRELRRGGQGAIWLARQHEPPRDVALKLLHGRDGATPMARQRFEREAELAARLRHPHVVTVYASGCAAGVPWCAMELVDGEPLDEWLRARTLPLRARLELFVKVARAVAHAHQRGVLHRDLKPGNVLVDRDAAPHVLDFGIARSLTPELVDAAGRADTDADEFVGTLAYAAPEQVAGDPAAIDTRTDVHALGAMLFEMVAGARPYDVSGGLAAAVARVAHAPPRRPRDVDPRLDRELAAVIETACAKDPERRYATADALADDIDRWLRCVPVAARGDGAWYVLRKAIARRRGLVAAAALALVVAGGGGALLVKQRLEADLSARTAADVRAVLLDLVAAARPDRMGGSVPLPEILAEAARRLDGRLDAVPDVRAELLLAIGETYAKLQRDDDAEPHLRAALEQARRADDPPLLARALQSLALVLGDRDEATPMLEEALAIRSRTSGPASGPAAQARSAIASVLVERHHAPDPARGEALQRQALTELIAAYGERDPEVARARLRLGWALEARRAGAGPAARDAAAFAAVAPSIEEQLQAAVAHVDELAAADPGLATQALHGLASFLQVERRFDEAQALLERALVITRASFGEERGPEVLRSFARLHYARGDLATAETVSRQALADELSRWARLRPDLAARITPVAARVADASAPPPWREAFELLRELRGDGSYEVAGWMNGIALLCMKQGRRDVALELVRGALRFHCRVWGDECPIRERALGLLAELEAEPAR